MQTYYDADTIVTNPDKSKQILMESIEAIKSNFIDLKQRGVIKEFEIRTLGTFPLDFYAIFDGKLCLVGKYLKNQSRKLNVGIKVYHGWKKIHNLLTTTHFTLKSYGIHLES